MYVVVSETVATNRAARYARCLQASKKAEWQVDRDVFRGRSLDFSKKFLPDGLSLIDRLGFLDSEDARFLSQLQGRTYAYVFGLVERFIGAKMLEQARAHSLGDQLALEGLVRFAGEELKHQELFRRLEHMMAAKMPAGYKMTAEPNAVAAAVLVASTWAVLALTCHIELFAQAHYEQTIAPREELCPLFKDVFRFHWLDECQHVLLDELEWTAEHERLSTAQRDHAVDQFIGLVAALDSILAAQSKADAEYFIRHTRVSYSPSRHAQIESAIFAAYRWQYIVSGVQHMQFGRLMTSMTTEAQMARIAAALHPIFRA